MYTTAIEQNTSIKLLQKFLHITPPPQVKRAKVIILFDNEDSDECEVAPATIQKSITKNSDFQKFYRLSGSI